MEDRASDVSSASQQSLSQPSGSRHLAGRGAWVLTAYGICGLVLFGLLAYFFSDFIVH